MAVSGWYVRLGGEAVGPLSAAELKDLAGRGGLAPDTPVSRDGVGWVPAAKVRGLALPVASPASATPPTVPAVSAVRPPVPTAKPSAATVPLIIASAGATVAILGCGVLGLLFAAAPALGPAVTAGATPVPAVATVTPASVGPTPEQLRATRTLAYWRRIPEALRVESGTSAKAKAAAARAIAARLRALPAAGVDPDAIACAVATADLFEDTAAFNERTAGPGLLVEAVVRTGRGDPWGASADLLAADRELRRRAAAVGQRLAAARARLSGRYGVEFPAIGP